MVLSKSYPTFCDTKHANLYYNYYLLIVILLCLKFKHFSNLFYNVLWELFYSHSISKSGKLITNKLKLRSFPIEISCMWLDLLQKEHMGLRIDYNEYFPFQCYIFLKKFYFSWVTVIKSFFKHWLNVFYLSSLTFFHYKHLFWTYKIVNRWRILNLQQFLFN